MFDSWNHWTWVSVAWIELIVAYGGYLVYLGWRRRKLLEDDRARRLLERPVDGGRP